MTRQEKAFIIAAIQEKAEREKEEQKKMKVSKPRKR
jgi:hypothetical protein